MRESERPSLPVQFTWILESSAERFSARHHRRRDLAAKNKKSGGGGGEGEKHLKTRTCACARKPRINERANEEVSAGKRVQSEGGTQGGK